MATRNQIDRVISRYKDDIDTAQATWIASHPKYKQYLRGDFNTSVEVHEYVRPDASVGYVILVFAVEGAETYIKTFVFGSEPINQITEWTLLVNTTS